MDKKDIFQQVDEEILRQLSDEGLKSLETKQYEHLAFQRKASIEIALADKTLTTQLISQKLTSDKNFFLGFGSALAVLAITLFAQALYYLGAANPQYTLGILVLGLAVITSFFVLILLIKHNKLKKEEEKYLQMVLDKGVNLLQSVDKQVNASEENIKKIVAEKSRRKSTVKST